MIIDRLLYLIVGISCHYVYTLLVESWVSRAMLQLEDISLNGPPGDALMGS